MENASKCHNCIPFSPTTALNNVVRNEPLSAAANNVDAINSCHPKDLQDPKFALKAPPLIDTMNPPELEVG